MADNNTAVLNDIVTRDQMASFMMCEDKKYHLIGEGFTDFTESKNPKEHTRKYVNYKTEVTDIIGYAPSFSYSCDVVSGDPVIKEIVNITDNEAVGSAAQREVITVSNWIPGATEGSFAAFKRTFSIIPSGKGSGTDALIYTGTMKARSDLVVGTFDVATSTFSSANGTV